METPTSQPSLADTVAAILAPPEETPQAPAAPPAPADPATITIPNHQNVPEKFRGKSLPDAFESFRNAERYMHEKSNEAAQLRRELDEERARRAAAEQLSRIQQAPPQQPVDPWGGVNPAEAVITDTGRFVNTTVDLAGKRAEAATEPLAARMRQLEAKVQASDSEKEATRLISVFEAAKEAVRKEGYNISDEQWKSDLMYIAPAIGRENDQYPGVVYNPARYVEHYKFVKGAPTIQKSTIPSEGNPPVASKPATGESVQGKPTISRETRQLYEQIGKAMGFAGDRLKTYIERQAADGGTR